MRTFKIDGHQVGVISGGEDRGGPPLILLHGITFTPHFWPPNLPDRLRESCRWFALSLPFHYPDRLEQRPDETVDGAFFARLLSGAIQLLVGEEPVVLIGHSLGGLAALSLAAHEPERVHRVVSICGIPDGKAEGLVARWQRLARGGRVGRSLFRTVWKLITASPHTLRLTLSLCAADRNAFLTSPRTSETLMAMYPDMCRHDPHALRYLLENLYHIDLVALFPRIQAPTLVIAGEQDFLVSHRRQQAIADGVPNSRLEFISGCGHMFFAERPDAIGDLLNEWILAPTGPAHG
jgi:pimeloyl-ACP methyl ester carboxylesterase